MNIQLWRVHIENFRSIKNSEIILNQFSVFFGMNDSGKSNFLNALNFAFNGGNITDTDIFSSPDYPYSKENSVIIDLMFIPINEKGDRVKSFDDAWGLHFGINVNTDSNDYEFFAFRTRYVYDNEKEEYVHERSLINSWENDNIVASKGFGFTTLRSFDFILLDAQRDIALDIRNKSSLWNRQIANIQLSEDIKTEIEDSLGKMGIKIKAASSILQEVETDLSDALNFKKYKVEVSPITKNIGELYKGLDIYVTPELSESFSIANLGLGTRSKAVFSVLKTVIRKRIHKSQSTPYFCILALEEPEAHIYPNSQRQLIQDLRVISGQKLITTHSPYLLSTSKMNDLIYVSLQKANSRYVSISTLNFDKEDIRKIERTVLNTRGDILFSAITILVEGETEEQALAIFFQEYFGNSTYSLGVNIVGVGGSGNNYLPFMQILENIGVKWFIFSDGEDDVINKLKNVLKNHKNMKEIDLQNFENIIVLEGNNFESYLVKNRYKSEIIKAINEYETDKQNEHPLSYFENYKEGYNKNHQKGDILDEDGILVKCMKNGKAKYAAIIAQTICKECNDDRKFPPKILELMEKIKAFLEEKK
jgi:putative ATP-dependent endonuclease of OLD family